MHVSFASSTDSVRRGVQVGFPRWRRVEPSDAPRQARERPARAAFAPLDDAVERLSTPRVRFEIRRKAFHIGGAILAVPIAVFLPSLWGIAFGLTVVAVIVATHFLRERRVRLQGFEALTDPVGDAIQTTRRPGETFPWAPVSFTLSLVGVGTAVWLLSLPVSYALAAFGILGFGDSASALVGVAYGQHKLPWNARKSWEGTMAGIVAGVVAAVALASFQHAWEGAVLRPALFGVFATSAVVGGLVETLPGQQDNWTVPLASLGTMILLARALGLV